MTHPLDQSIAELLNASRDDRELLSFPINDRSFGFHAQQAVEKLPKALIGARQTQYKYAHDIESSLMDVVALKEELRSNRRFGAPHRVRRRIGDIKSQKRFPRSAGPSCGKRSTPFAASCWSVLRFCVATRIGPCSFDASAFHIAKQDGRRRRRSAVQQ